MAYDDLALPLLEPDLPLVLAARPVLGEQTWPVIPVRLDDDAPGAVTRKTFIPGRTRAIRSATSWMIPGHPTSQDTRNATYRAAGDKQPVTQVEAQ